MKNIRAGIYKREEELARSEDHELASAHLDELASVESCADLSLRVVSRVRFDGGQNKRRLGRLTSSSKMRT